MTVQRSLRGPVSPWSVEDDKPISENTGSALVTRAVRDQVRYTASLYSSFRPVFEQMGARWACDFGDRIIYWRTTMPFEPYRNLSPKEIFFLIGHEAGHLNFTGGWETPDEWSQAKRDAFNGFLNAVEDIRIERLMAREFPGFGEIRGQINREFMKFHVGTASMFYAAWDQVAFNWLQIESDPERKIGRIGTRGAQIFADDTWPEIDRIVHAPTSNKVAKAVIPIFERLWQEQMADSKERRSGDYGQGNGENLGKPEPGGGGGEDGTEDQRPGEKFKGAGDGFPTEPSEENWDEFPHWRDTMSRLEQLRQMIKNARGQGKAKLERAEIGEKKAADAAKAVKDMVEAPNSGRNPADGIGTDPDPFVRPPGDHWARTKERLRPEINALAHRFRSVLKTNQMSAWQENLGRGSLNTRRARRAVAGNNRIFRRRYEIGAHDYVFGIINDVSGSMAKQVDNRRVADYALDTTVLMIEALDKAGMKTFIVTCDTRVRCSKEITQRIPEVAEDIAADIHRSNGGTYEAPSLIMAQEEFRTVRSGHKVLFILSDGHTSQVGDSQILTRELLNEGVSIIGIGLRIDPPAHHPVKYRVDDISTLPHTLPRLINEIVRKGAR